MAFYMVLEEQAGPDGVVLVEKGWREAGDTDEAARLFREELDASWRQEGLQDPATIHYRCVVESAYEPRYRASGEFNVRGGTERTGPSRDKAPRRRSAVA